MRNLIFNYIIRDLRLKHFYTDEIVYDDVGERPLRGRGTNGVVGRATVVRLNGVDEMDSVDRWCAYARIVAVCVVGQRNARGATAAHFIRRRAVGPSLRKPTTPLAANHPSTTNHPTTANRHPTPQTATPPLYMYIPISFSRPPATRFVSAKIRPARRRDFIMHYAGDMN